MKEPSGPAHDMAEKGLTVTTCQAANTASACSTIAAYLAETLEKPVRIVDDIGWQERKQQLSCGRISIGWVCGLWYILLADGETNVRLLAAPVTAGKRYANRPVYFSDVVVSARSPYGNFAALKGARWAYNEALSYSGHYVVRAHLARLGESGPYFNEIVESGGHARSIEMILDGKVDGAAIDSTYLDYLLTTRPPLRQKIRVVETLGPSPAPPWVLFGGVPIGQGEQVRHALLTMHQNTRGRATLAAGGLTRFAAVTDQYYEPIREAYRAGAAVRFDRSSNFC